MNKCKICNKEFKSKMALAGHMASHKTKTSASIRHERTFDKYSKNPKLCFYCGVTIPYDKRRNNFCSSSCAASCNNTGRTKEYVKVNNSIVKRKSVEHCKNCGKEIDFKKKYCDLTCQHEYERQKRIKLWLESGKASVSSHKGHYIREYIMDDQNDKCAICDNLPVWNDAPIVFILDHISGNSEDNSRENLRLICPNCDSQLDTYKAKNTGNGRAWRRQRYAEGKSY